MQYTSFTAEQHSEIIDLYTQVFGDSEGENEGKVIGELVSNLLTENSADDLFCYLAINDQQIIGAIIFSKMTFETAINSYILSPVAVSTKVQKQGIGQALINYGIEQLKAKGVELLLTYGDPNYYSKVGYQPVEESVIKAPQPLSFPHGWLAQSLISENVPTIAGNSECVAALNKAEYW